MAKAFKGKGERRSVSDGKQKDNTLKEVLSLSSIGMSMVISIIIGLAIGYYIDKYLGTKPWFMLLFLIFGIIAGFKNLYKAVKKYGCKDD